MDYQDFLKSKEFFIKATGFDVDKKDINAMLFDFQKDIVVWALKKGKAAIFADCGLGKSPMQLEWAYKVCEHTNGNVLILAPLAVSKQTQREGMKFDREVHICREQKDVKKGINITNYEMIEHFNADQFSGVVLDESSILKNYSGQTRNLIIDTFKNTQYKLACTATPSPNDYMELGNHSEFLDVMKRSSMLATFFTHDGSDTANWILRGYAEDKFWEWVSKWAVVIKNPSDLGYDGKNFILPKLNIKTYFVDSKNLDGYLIPMGANTLEERRDARKSSIKERVDKCVEIIGKSKEQWLIWCDYNNEGDLAEKSICDSEQVSGSDTDDHKENTMMNFSSGKVKILVTKSKIAGFGMNWQNCHNVIFLGLSDSYERYYQAIRRCWRFGQKNEVNAHIILSDKEMTVFNNITRKEKDAENMSTNMLEHTKNFNKKELHHMEKQIESVETKRINGDGWSMYMGDSCEVVKELKDNSIGYTIFSPPFAELYTYSDSIRDMGNSKNYDEFFVHFSFLISEIHRITMNGRLVSVHCIDIPAMKEKDGFIGIKNFSGDIITAFEKVGFIYHSRHTIWKDPLIEATRTKAIGLMHRQITKDSSMCRSGLPDYLLTFRKKGENAVPIDNENGLCDYEYFGKKDPDIPRNKIEYSHNVWRSYASPVWMDIRQTHTLQKSEARSEKDVKHICPLQLDVIARGLVLWSKENDMVFSPFAGIGSEGYQAVKMGRKFIGIELKKEYYDCAVNNLSKVEIERKQAMLL
jgi:DNA modification methylase